MSYVTPSCYWPQDFLDEVESEAVQDGMMIWSVGGPSLILRTPTATIYIDPFFGTIREYRRSIAIPINPNSVRLADLLLSTHKHVDHCHEESIVPIATNTGALSAGPASSVEVMRCFDMELPEIRQLSPGDRLFIGDTEVLALAANDAWEDRALTYLVRSGGAAVFVGGDTASSPQFAEVGEQYDIDTAFLAYSGVHMEPDELLQLANLLRTKIVVPYHWDLFHGWNRSPLEFCGMGLDLTAAPEFRLLFLGDRLWLRGKGVS